MEDWVAVDRTGESLAMNGRNGRFESMKRLIGKFCKVHGTGGELSIAMFRLVGKVSPGIRSTFKGGMWH